MSTRLVLALLLLTGCASASRGPVTSAPTEELVLRVSSEADKLTVYLSDGAVRERVGTVMGGRTETIRVRRRLFGTVYLTAESVHGRVDFVAEWTPGGMDCWSWSLPRTGFRTHDISRFPVPCHGVDPMAMDTIPIPRDRAWVQATMHEAWLGFTACGTKPTAWVRVDVLSSEEGPQVIAHEQAHVAAVLRDGGCEMHAVKRMLDPDYRMKMEALAFCASSKVWSRQVGLKLEQGIRRFATALAYNYPFGLTPEAAAMAIRAAGCQEE